MNKKLYWTLVLSSVFTVQALAQSAPTKPVAPIDSTAKAATVSGKFLTGHLADVINNYIQVAAKNVTSSTSNVQLTLNWSLFHKKMDSAALYKNPYFKNTAWQRNGEFVFSGGISKTNAFNSVSGGFNYNLLNRRDTSAHYYTAAYYGYFKEEDKLIYSTVQHYKGSLSADFATQITTVVTKLYAQGKPVTDLEAELKTTIKGLPDSTSADKGRIKYLQDQLNEDIRNQRAGKSSLSGAMETKIGFVASSEANAIIGDAINVYVKGLGKKSLDFGIVADAKFGARVSKYIDSLVASDKLFRDTLKVKTLADVNKKVISNFEDLVKYVAQQPLLTFGYAYTYGTGTVLSSHVGGFTYAQGLTPLNDERTVSLTGSLTDTLSSTDPTGKVRNLGRNLIALQGGFNKILVVQQKQSLMELNLAVEDDEATSGYVTKKQMNVFSLNAYFRARLLKTPWLKLAIKYDPKNANVLGFLDFTYNLDK